MKPIDWILVILIAGLMAWAVNAARKKSGRGFCGKNCGSCGGGCCGTSEPPVKRLRKGRLQEEKLTEAYELWIGGMTCDNCAARVQNALNRMDGVSAKVSISEKKASVRCEVFVTEADLKKAVSAEGYTVLKAEKNEKTVK